jgi:hypothetical protein
MFWAGRISGSQLDRPDGQQVFCFFLPSAGNAHTPARIRAPNLSGMLSRLSREAIAADDACHQFEGKP